MDRIGGPPRSARTQAPQLPLVHAFSRSARAAERTCPDRRSAQNRAPLPERPKESLAWNTTFDLLTLALLREVSPRAARQLLSRGPLASTLSRSARDHARPAGSTRDRGAAQRRRAARRRSRDDRGAAARDRDRRLRRRPLPAVASPHVHAAASAVGEGLARARRRSERASPSSARARRARSGSPSPGGWPTSSRARASSWSPAWRAGSTRPRTAARSTRAAARWPSWAPGLDRHLPAGERGPGGAGPGERRRRERVPAGRRALEAPLPEAQPRDRRLGRGRWWWSRRAPAAGRSPRRGRRSTRGAT